MRPANRRYGQWAGNPKGRPEDVRRCVEEVGFGDRGAWHRQCPRPRGYGKEGLYCKQHAGTEDREQAREEEARRKREADEQIQEEGRTLVARMGGGGNVFFQTLGKFRDHGHRRALVIPFELVERYLKIEAALRDCVDSLQYVNATHPEASGRGVRAERINTANKALEKPNGLHGTT